MKVLFLLVGISISACAGITLDNSKMTCSAGAVTSFSYSFTVATGSSAIYVGVAGYIGSSASVSTLTVGGASATLVKSQGGLGSGHAEIWRLMNPPTGSVTIAISVTGNSTGDSICSSALSLFGVNNSPNDGSNGITNSGTTTSLSQTVSTSQANDWIFDIIATLNGGEAPGASQTALTGSPITSSGSTTAGSSYYPNAPAGTPMMSWTYNSTGSGVPWVSVSIKAAPPAKGGGYAIVM